MLTSSSVAPASRPGVVPRDDRRPPTGGRRSSSHGAFRARRAAHTVACMTTQTTTQLDPLPETGTLVRLARLVLRHRRAVVAAWLVLLIAGAAAAPRVSSRLTFDFALPGEPGYETAKQIVKTYGNGAEQAPSIAVVTVPTGQTVEGDQAKVAAAFAQVRRELPRLRVVDLGSTHDRRFVTRDGRTTYALVFGPRAEGFGGTVAGDQAKPVLERALPAGYGVSTTGLQELSSGGKTG